MKSIFTKISLLICALVVVGCTTQPIKTINSQVPEGLTKAQVSESIKKAGSIREWVITDNGEDQLIGKLLYKGDLVIVNIPYNETTYSILYKSTSGLNYDAKDRTVHRAYNKWTAILNEQIQKQLMIAEVS
jgi:hypothetical protein